ncbi:MAG: hypothetical protein GOVbin1578_5 [Prokaryotic dsDNA virus sp.]|nr:MAG: hypothetical protein GOVbin1578_5 [Prokaryotic dsDNA virus sp.]|tara:strand:+ start:9368 stop:9586 length:219 start_codon:yes stop_codon:yes gene_type:complete
MSDFFNFDDKIMRDRCGKKAVYVSVDLYKKLKYLAKTNKINKHKLAEYFVSMGTNTAMHNPQQSVKFDITKL